MYENLRGKRILIVGSGAEEEIVKTAHEMGLYVVVVDNELNRKIARAKVIADEAWDISYYETDEIVEKCIASRIDGVFAGYGEFRVIAACRIAEKLGKPFYITESQIDLTRNKLLFKTECEKCGIPVPKSFCKSGVMTEEEKASVEYPVIVKPTDRSGRIGISVCADSSELENALEYALSKSESKTVIVEEYLSGTEFSTLYTASKGELSLSCVNAKYITRDQKVPNCLCDCAMSPAPFTERFLAQMDEKCKVFLKGLGLKNGMATIQGMYTEKGFYAFEMGMRINGNNDWKVISRENGINFLKMMLAYSLTGDMTDSLEKDDPRFRNYYCTLPIFAHGGVIAKFDIDRVLEQPWAELSNLHVEVGSKINEDGTNRQKLCAILIHASSRDELFERIRFMQDNIVAEDASGNNMLFLPFDYSVIA